MTKRFAASAFFACMFACCLGQAHAGVLSYVSDLITASAPDASSMHTIQFTLAQDIPPSGQITIVPVGAFMLPAGFDDTDMELSVATDGTYVDVPVAASPDATNDGISVTTGASSDIVITLNSTEGMAAGDKVRVVLASSTAPQYDPQNPAGTGSYRIRINTKSGSGSAIDYGTAMIAVIAPVSVSGAAVQHAPLRSNGEPSGTISADNSIVELSLTTDELATCRYATTTDIAYGSMTGQFTPPLGTTFYTDLTGFQDGDSYNFYVRCSSAQGLANTDDYDISFSVAAAPISNTSISQSGSAGNGGVGPYPDGSSVLYLGSVKLEGVTSPGASVTVLQDGAKAASVQAGSDGSFTATVNGLERGTYTFGTYATDQQGRNTSIDSETFTTEQGTTDSLSGIVLPPTIAIPPGVAPIGTDVGVTGESVPGAQIQLVALSPSGSTQTFSATSSPAGSWSVTIPSGDLSQGAYQVKAQAIQSANSSSDYSDPLTLNVGVVPSSTCNSSPDLNGDGSVNLIDFSIMLTAWGTSDSKADLNCDGTVNLADLSILLFHWTG